MQDMVQDHEKRIISLEQNYSEVQRELTTVQNSQLRTENTVMSESREQKVLLNRLLDHVLDARKFNLTKKWQLILAIFGGGGAFYAVIQILGDYLK